MINASNFRRLLYSTVIVLLFSSSLTAIYTVEFFYSGAQTYSGISPSEKAAYKWIYENVPRNATFLAFSDASCYGIQSLALRNAICYSQLELSWPAAILFNSRLPEALLYSLWQLNVSYIFVGRSDVSILDRSLQQTYVYTLLSILSPVYQNDAVKIYHIPNYSLREDSNYVLVEPTLDFLSLPAMGPNIEFYDNFSGNLGRWLVHSGKWEVTNNTLHGYGTKTWNYILSNASFDNFIYQFRARSGQKAEPRYIWGVFRWVDENNCYSFYIGSNTYLLGEAYNGKWRAIAGGSHNLNLNLSQWVQVRVVANLSNVELIVNNHTIAKGKGLGLEGRVGLATYGGYSTFYDDVKVTSITQSVDSESSFSYYRLVFGALLSSGTKFSVIQDINISELENYRTYIFPSNERLPSRLLRTIYDSMLQGASIVFFNDGMGTRDELNNLINFSIITFLGAKIKGFIPVSSMLFGNERYQLSSSFSIPELLFTNGSNVSIQAYYVANEGVQVPLIVQRKIGHGALTYINLPYTAARQLLLNPEGPQIYSMLIDRALGNPNRFQGTKPWVASYIPTSVYRFILANDIQRFLLLPDLNNFVYVYDPSLEANGSVEISSNWALLRATNLSASTLSIRGASGDQITPVSKITDLEIYGSVMLVLQTNRFRIDKASNITGNLFRFTELGNTDVSIKLINAEAQVEFDGGGKIKLANDSMILSLPASDAGSITLYLSQPTVKIAGEVKLKSWQGVFWYKDHAVVNFETHSSILAGEVTVKLLHFYGAMSVKVLSVEKIEYYQVYD